MVQTYQGYFTEDGRFIPDGISVKLPTRRRAIVNVFVEEKADNVLQEADTELQDRVQRISMIIKAASDAENDTLSDNDWDEMLTLRSQTNAGLSRVVEL